MRDQNVTHNKAELWQRLSNAVDKCTTKLDICQHRQAAATIGVAAHRNMRFGEAAKSGMVPLS